ncbi:hypothetical protein AHAS_AhasUnG0055000 [Arachis hypogaea]
MRLICVISKARTGCSSKSSKSHHQSMQLICVISKAKTGCSSKSHHPSLQLICVISKRRTGCTELDKSRCPILLQVRGIAVSNECSSPQITLSLRALYPDSRGGFSTKLERACYRGTMEDSIVDQQLGRPHSSHHVWR